MRRTGIWMSVVGVLLTILGAVVVLVLRDGPDPKIPPATQPAPGVDAGSGTATTVAGAPTPNRPTGTIAARPAPGAPASTPDAPPPATPEQVAELLAGLPLQLEQAATSEGQPRELTPEEVDKIIEDLLRQLGAQP